MYTFVVLRYRSRWVIRWYRPLRLAPSVTMSGQVPGVWPTAKAATVVLAALEAGTHPLCAELG